MNDKKEMKHKRTRDENNFNFYGSLLIKNPKKPVKLIGKPISTSSTIKLEIILVLLIINIPFIVIFFMMIFGR